MAKTAIIHARVEPKVKRQAESVLRRVGLSASEAINVFYRRIIAAQGIPFPVRIPNAETRAAMKEVESGKLKKFATSEELFADLKS